MASCGAAFQAAAGFQPALVKPLFRSVRRHRREEAQHVVALLHHTRAPQLTPALRAAVACGVVGRPCARGPAFLRVQPAGKPAAGWKARPTLAVFLLLTFFCNPPSRQNGKRPTKWPALFETCDGTIPRPGYRWRPRRPAHGRWSRRQSPRPRRFRAACDGTPASNSPAPSAAARCPWRPTVALPAA